MTIRLIDSQLLRTIRTVRRLRWSQIAARGYRVTRRQWSNWHAPDAKPAFTSNRAVDFPVIPEFDYPCARGETLVNALESCQLPLLNESLRLGEDALDWRLGAVSSDRLSAITLHYHQWLYELAKLSLGQQPSAERAGRLFQRYLTDWLQHCEIEQPGVQELAWNSYAIATRLAWSIQAHELLCNGNAQMPSSLIDAWLKSLWRQAAHLHANLEWDLRANHLLRDAVGLAWAGRYFSEREADCWMRTATRLAVRQADEQMLADGGHFERSPFYHLEVMDDWLSLALLLRDQAAREKMRHTWQRAAEYACWLRHPDGRAVQWNDGAAISVDEHLRHGAAIGVEPDLAPRSGGRYFEDSGVIVWHGQPWSVFFDVGRIGPDYQPGHAHADTLTMDCSFAGQRLFVDPGCHSYDNNERRRYDRATDSHNTVCIDGTDSSEMWHIFRVGRRALPTGVEANFTCDTMHAAAAHDGYHFLPGRPRHRRTVQVKNGESLRVVDVIDGRKHHEIAAGYLLDPCWQAEAVNGGWRLQNGSIELFVQVHGTQPLELTTKLGAIHPEFGMELPSTRLCWRYEGELPLKIETEVSTRLEGKLVDC